ncbi:ethanolamine ammonia-lyase [Deltaproteobacteria bacterium Smac51]|nr:ethanolamine ammonia-lyase [Deltaproteobacteria bacterium Smac51]
MVTEHELKKAVEAILMEMGGKIPAASCGSGPAQSGPARTSAVEEGSLPDLGAIDLQEAIYVPNPHNMDALKAMKKSTPARIGVWRAGPRYLTETLLRFRADHAVAMDAVFTDVSEEWIKDHNLPHFKTMCDSKDTYLTRPDLGRKFDDDEAKKIKAHVGGNNKVVIFIADGLSTTAVTTNAMDTYKAIVDGLARHNIKPAAPFFVQYARVGTEDAISEITGAEVVCALIGERPGLITAESMSAYMAYKATVDMPEARRTVVSNIHRRGTPAVEAGGYIADIIKMMLDKKVSGIDLKL